MKHPQIFALLACLSLAYCGGAAASDGASPLRLVGRALQVCQPLAGISAPLCRSGQLPVRFGTITRAVTL